MQFDTPRTAARRAERYRATVVCRRGKAQFVVRSAHAPDPGRGVALQRSIAEFVSIRSNTASGVTSRLASANSGSASTPMPMRVAIDDTSVVSLVNLMLSQQADLKVEIGPFGSSRRHAILADEHECRQEDRLIPLRHRRYPADIRRDPSDEKDKVQKDECHAAHDTANGIGEALLARRRRLLALTMTLQRADVALEDRRQAVPPMGL
jgi:hypothetical protein